MAVSEGSRRILRGSVTAWWALLLCLVASVFLVILAGGETMGDSLFFFLGALAVWLAGVWWWVIQPLLDLVKDQRLRLCALRQDLACLDRFRGEVLATLSHALRTPAATVKDIVNSSKVSEILEVNGRRFMLRWSTAPNGSCKC